jgi:hypothetical protein
VKMESLIQELEIHDQQGTRSFQSLVPANEKMKSRARKFRPETTREWGNTIIESRLPNTVLQFQALAIPCKYLKIISKTITNPVISVARPNLAHIQRTVIDFLLPGGQYFPGTLVSTSLEISSTTQLQSCDLIFLSVSQSGESDSNSFTNVMLVQWTGEFAERVAIGSIKGAIGPEWHPDWPGYRVALDLYFTHPVTDCYWKTIRLI